MSRPEFFINVLLPLAIEGTYTYHCTKEEFENLQKGMRVAVEFGRQKVQTAIVLEKHRQPPLFPTKPVLEILDDKPILNDFSWQLIDFINRYYITTPGKTLRLALPSSFLLENETLVSLLETENIPWDKLNDTEFLILEAIQKNGILKIGDIAKIAGSPAKAIKIINRFAAEKWVAIHYFIKEKYSPKFITYIDLADKETPPSRILETISSRAKKQQELFLRFLDRYLPSRQPVLLTELKKEFGYHLIKSLIDKGIFQKIEVPVDRQVFEDNPAEQIVLNEHQLKAFKEIEKAVHDNKPILFHGVTAAGKTEIYIKFIERVLASGKQVLYMVPEIGLTAQLVNRLKKHFGNRTAVYHSRYSPAERREIWMNALEGKETASLVIGTRSAVFVPFKNLGMIIVDEEHDDSFKEAQHEPAYHGRDTAVVLAKIHQCPVILGSATPSFDSYFNAQQGKYAYVSLKEKYHQTPEPEKVVLDFTQAYKEGRVKKDFIRETLEAIKRTVDAGLQVMVFLNRRGFAPIVTCKSCGYTENCPHCSVSLTYHREENKLKCHYCGYTIDKAPACRACGSPDLSIQGTGTEKIENQLKEIFPHYRIARMDSSVVHGKHKAAEIITDFENKKYDIIIGTQMITKGLDFGNTGLVVVVNADKMIHFPEFRAHERAFQTLVQVAGRTGRRNRKDAVYIQTFQPEHPVIRYFLANDYEGMFRHEMKERQLFKYPPYYRLIKIELRSKNPQNLHEAARWLKNALTHYFKLVLGPSEPVIYKIRDFYHLELLIKLEAGKNTMLPREWIYKILIKFKSIGRFRNVKVKANADPNG